MGFAGKKRVDERTRTAFLLQLRVISHALLGFARACKSRITKPLSLLRVAACCTVLRSQWYQSGINIALVSTYPRRSPDLSSQSCRPSGLESPAQTAVAGRRSNPVSSDLTMTGTPGEETCFICSTRASLGVP